MENFIDNLTSVWDFFKNTDKPVILYGMGDGADKVLDRFDKLNIKVSGVMASDGFVRYQNFRGFTVKSFADFETEFGDFVLALCFGSSLPDVMDYIKDVAQKRKLLVPSVPVFGENIFDIEFYEKNKSEINRAYALLADGLSRRVFGDILRFQYSGELKYLESCTSDKDEAFRNILKLTDNEDYLDLGAYSGDTIDELLKYCGGYSSITAFEPSEKSFKKLKDKCSGMENVSLWQLGSYNFDGFLNFNTKSGRNCSISEGGVKTAAARVDTILAKKRITYAKIDVEGAEKQTLEGMELTLKEFKPKLNVAAYHRGEDIFALILQLHAINPDYRFYLRHHPYIPHWDTNLYAV